MLTQQDTSPLSPTKKPRFFYGYIVVVAAVIIQAIAWGTSSAFGVFFIPLLTEFGWSRATVSGAASLCEILIGLGAIVLGGLSDKIGPRLLMAACGLVTGLGYLLLGSQLNTLWQLYLFYGVMVGMGLSGTDVILLSTTARWFVKKRGLMTGIVKSGTGVGMLAVPVVASWLISTYDWRRSYATLGAVTLALIVLPSQFLRRDPCQMGQLPDGGEGAAASCVDSTEMNLSFQEALHTRQLWMISAAYFTIFFCAGTVLVHIVPHAVDLGFSATLAGALISAIGGTSIVGRLMMGIAGDRMGNKQALIICFVILIAAVSLLLLSEELWTLYLFAAGYGFAHGGFYALMSPMVAQLFGTRSLGIILGTVIFSGTIGGTISPVLAGYIFDVTDPHSYEIAFWVLLSMAITGCISVISLGSTTPERRTAD